MAMLFAHVRKAGEELTVLKTSMNVLRVESQLLCVNMEARVSTIMGHFDATACLASLDDAVKRTSMNVIQIHA